MAPNSTGDNSENGPTSFHEVISKDHPIFKPEPDRYLLYGCYACPWDSRILMACKIKKLDEFIKFIPVSPVFNDDHLWQFSPDVAAEPVMEANFLRDIYLLAANSYSGNFSVPVLFDKKTKRIVNNDPAEIFRMVNTAFNEVIIEQPTADLYPESLRKEIDILTELISEIQQNILKIAYCLSPRRYEAFCRSVFCRLDRLEAILSENRFLVGEIFTEADIHLFSIIIRFPTVYETLFKCNVKTLRDDSDYPNLHKWAKTVYQIPGVTGTVNQDHIKQSYYKSMKHLNPGQFVPLYSGPDLSFPNYPVKNSYFAWPS